jgi:hypothetical protein
VNESARAAGCLQLGSRFLSFSSGKHFCFYLAYFYLVFLLAAWICDVRIRRRTSYDRPIKTVIFFFICVFSMRPYDRPPNKNGNLTTSSFENKQPVPPSIPPSMSEQR